MELISGGRKKMMQQKPCPYCHSKNIEVCQIILPRWGCYGRCKDCRMRGPEQDSKAEAIRAWNKLGKRRFDVMVPATRRTYRAMRRELDNFAAARLEHYDRMEKAEAELEMWRKDEAVDTVPWWSRREDDMWMVSAELAVKAIVDDTMDCDPGTFKMIEPSKRLQSFIERVENEVHQQKM